jgi:hypothetical protein
LFPSEAGLWNDVWFPFEFCFAVIAIQVQALDHLFEAAESDAVRNAVIASLTREPTARGPIEGFRRYESAWRTGVSTRQIAYRRVAEAICRAMEIGTTDPETGAIDPRVVEAMADALTRCSPDWWKVFLAKHTILFVRKEQVTPLQAVARFQHDIMMMTRSHWREAVAPILGYHELAPEEFEDTSIQYEFALAVTAYQAESVDDLLPPSIAAHVHLAMTAAYTIPHPDASNDETAVQAFAFNRLREYHHAWNESLGRGRPALAGIGRILCKHIGLGPDAGDKWDVDELNAVTECLTRCAPPWWSRFLATHEIILRSQQ